MKKLVFVFLLFVLSVSVFAKNFYACYLNGKWVLQPTGVYTLWFNDNIFHIGVLDGNEYKSFSQKFYVSYNKVDSFDTRKNYVGRRGNYIVFQDTVRTSNGVDRYVTCNYRIKDLKSKEKLVLEIDGKEYTFKYAGRE